MWEEALMVVILVAIAAHLESSALENARDLMQVGLDRIPKTARRLINTPSKLTNVEEIQMISFEMTPTSMLSPNNAQSTQHGDVVEKHETISLELVNIGDIIEIRSGELIPADGNVIDGFGALDKSPLTGESVPIEVTVGDNLHAGLILARGPVLVEVTAVGEATRLSGLIETVHSFKEQKPAIQNQLEQFTAIWVPLVLVGALVVWYLMFPRDNWKIILLLWVVACPCALLLAAAMPHAAALSKSSRMGAIVRGGETLERLGKVNHVMLDKTGTLTSGKPTLGNITIAKGRQKKAAMALAGGLEQRSSHPYAVTILEYLESNSIKPSVVAGITDIEAGVKGFSSGKEVFLIRADLAEKHGISISSEISSAISQAKQNGHGASLLAKESEAIAVFSFIHDDTRGSSKELIQKLLDRGIGVEIISGDQQSSVTAFAKSVGLPEQFALGSLSPEDKVQWVEDKSKSHVTMMVGDGFNDSAALAVADVGVAVGTGESVNLEAADIMFPGEDPKMLVDLHDLAVKMNRALIGNIFLSISITLILVIAVINQLYDQLWVGVLIHEASVLLVIFNGARLAGRGSMLAMLMVTMKTLWLDTKQVFIQMKEHYSKRESNTNLEQANQNHATS
jgi:Cd2+/Zn2+-exporting ATPase